MKRLLAPALGLLLLGLFFSLQGSEVARVDASEAARLVEGGALLIDVREPAEWMETGVAAPALLLPLSDFEGGRDGWKPFLAGPAKDKTLVLYCRSGNRSGRVAAALAKEGYQVVNGGAFKDWEAAGLPVRKLQP